MAAMKPQLGEKIDECDVCDVPIAKVEKPFLADFKDKVYSFCSERCFEEFTKDPMKYTSFEDDDIVE